MGEASCEFRDGALEVAGPFRRYRIRWLPRPVAEECDHRGRWNPSFPEFRLLAPVLAPGEVAGGDDPSAEVPPGDRAKWEAFLAFRRTLPEELIPIVEGFPSHQWNMLVLMARSPAALDLARSNPVLAFCVANNHEFRNCTAEVAASMAPRHCLQRRREIAGWLGFPATDASVNVLSRIRPEAADPGMLRALRQSMADGRDVVRMLGHIPAINAGVLFFAARWRLREMATPALLEEIAGDVRELEMAQAGRMLSDALRPSGLPGDEERTRPFHSIGQIWKFHQDALRRFEEARLELERRRQAEAQAAERRKRAEAIEAELRRRQGIQLGRARRAARAFEARLPHTDSKVGPADEAVVLAWAQAEMSCRPALRYGQPPVPGTDKIVPIAGLPDLVAEGRVQGNCAAGYDEEIRSGRCCLYRVLTPARCTLQIVPGPGGRWQIAQLKGTRNTAAPAEVWQMVRAWLRGHSLGL